MNSGKPSSISISIIAHSIPGHSRPMGHPHLTWMDTTMHDKGSLGRTLHIDLPRDWAN